MAGMVDGTTPGTMAVMAGMDGMIPGTMAVGAGTIPGAIMAGMIPGMALGITATIIPRM